MGGPPKVICIVSIRDPTCLVTRIIISMYSLLLRVTPSFAEHETVASRDMDEEFVAVAFPFQFPRHLSGLATMGRLQLIILYLLRPKLQSAHGMELGELLEQDILTRGNLVIRPIRMHALNLRTPVWETIPCMIPRLCEIACTCPT